MKNPFLNVDNNRSKVKSQQKDGGKISLKRRGRPRRPNMVKKLIKVDEVLYAQVVKLAEKESTTIAAILARALKKEIKDI